MGIRFLDEDLRPRADRIIQVLIDGDLPERCLPPRPRTQSSAMTLAAVINSENNDALV
jgi:hypothetical protein